MHSTQKKPATFDAPAFVADLKAAGTNVERYQGHVYFRPDEGFGTPYFTVMNRWADRIAACPDWLDRVEAAVEEYRAPGPV